MNGEHIQNQYRLVFAVVLLPLVLAVCSQKSVDLESIGDPAHG